ncbi:MAG: TadE/TadG family type IV pilus assembly protein [Myxococcota bacterium]
MALHRPALRRRARRGANAIEFALTLPIFLALVLGVMDYGNLFAIQAGMDNAVALSCREGALQDPAHASPIAVANNEFASRAPMFCGPGCTFTVTPLNTGEYAYPHEALRCRAVRSVSSLSGYVPFPSTVESTSYYRLEWPQP